MGTHKYTHQTPTNIVYLMISYSKRNNKTFLIQRLSCTMTLKYCLDYIPHSGSSVGARTIHVSILISQSLGTIGVRGFFDLVIRGSWRVGGQLVHYLTTKNTKKIKTKESSYILHNRQLTNFQVSLRYENTRQK